MPPEPAKAVSQQKVSKDFDRFVSSYGQQINDAVAFSGLKADFFVRAKCEYLLRLTRRNLGDNSALEVLDLGCGIANYHSLIAPKYKSLSGIDVSARSIEEAQQNNPAVSYTSYSGGRLPYPDASFNVAFAMCVMHHVPVPSWPEFVSEMKRVLRPGGLGVVFEHNPWNPVTQRIVNSCPIDADAVLLKGSKTRSLLAEAGFGDIKVRSILSIPPVAGPLYPADEGLGLLGLGAQYYASGRKPS